MRTFLSIVLALGLTACSTEQEPDNSSTRTTPDSQEMDPEPADDPAFAITVLKTEDCAKKLPSFKTNYYGPHASYAKCLKFREGIETFYENGSFRRPLDSRACTQSCTYVNSRQGYWIQAKTPKTRKPKTSSSTTFKFGVERLCNDAIDRYCDLSHKTHLCKRVGNDFWIARRDYRIPSPTCQ